MLRFVTKAQYWKVLDAGVMDGVRGTGVWHLKDIQDAIACSHLRESQGLDIAEIGAGHSRLIELLAKENRCTAIDEYKGFGGGPKTKPNIANVRFAECMIGNSQDVIPAQSFDVLYSVSVVEHVAIEGLAQFFLDCHRILRPGGKMVHLIDAYVEDSLGSNQELWLRVEEYLKPFGEWFEPLGKLQFSCVEDLAFRSAYATNPDNVMRQWNSFAPGHAKKRQLSQSCAIEMAGIRIA